MKTALIVGYGRFGELLADLCEGYFDVSITDESEIRCELAKKKNHKVVTISEASHFDIIFIAVPISIFKSTCTQLAKLINNEQLIADVCSVKVYPAKIMQEMFSCNPLIATHPMFGPDSAKDGLTNLQVVVCPLRGSAEDSFVIKDFWSSKGATVIESSPEQHDQDTAYSQAFTYSIAKLINLSQIPSVRFVTRSFLAIAEVARLSANDTDQLFHDMLFYNPYYSTMKQKFEESMRKTSEIMDSIERKQSEERLDKS